MLIMQLKMLYHQLTFIDGNDHFFCGYEFIYIQDAYASILKHSSTGKYITYIKRRI